MAKNPTIFDQAIYNLGEKINERQHKIDVLKRANAELREEVDSTNRSMDRMSWNDRVDAKNDIRDAETKIRINDEYIEQYTNEIKQFEQEIQEHMKLKDPSNDR
ncbi:MAG: hypothetical protein J5679_02890 [Alphaproteobacteria bacterium]|nr:hypothetical protein [Alphaproteobacteria bacterium]